MGGTARHTRTHTRSNKNSSCKQIFLQSVVNMVGWAPRWVSAGPSEAPDVISRVIFLEFSYLMLTSKNSSSKKVRGDPYHLARNFNPSRVALRATSRSMEGDPMVSQGAPGPRGQTETHPASGFVAPAWASVSVAQFRTRNFAQMKVQSGSYVFVVCASALFAAVLDRAPSSKQQTRWNLNVGPGRRVPKQQTRSNPKRFPLWTVQFGS